MAVFIVMLDISHINRMGGEGNFLRHCAYTYVCVTCHENGSLVEGEDEVTSSDL